MTAPEDISGSKPDSESLTFFNMLFFIPPLAAKASWDSLKAGIPFGGTLGATLMVVMSNDSGEYPFAPFVAAALALPVAILCDILFYIPCHVLRYLAPKKENVD